MRLTFVALRAVVAVLLVGAIGSQLGEAVGEHADAGGTEAVAAVTNVLSYVTIQSNALAVVVLMLSAAFLLHKDNPVTAANGWATVRTYIAVLTAFVSLLATAVIATSHRASRSKTSPENEPSKGPA